MRWLELVQLFRTGREAGRSLQFAHFADQRETQATCPPEIYELQTAWSMRPDAKRSEYLIDYVADTGDGYDATFAVAACVSGAETRPPADLLVFGGDEVYPVASVQDYENRFKLPFEDAYAEAPADAKKRICRSFTVALPGNHDWYDGLVAFRRNFCESWVVPRPSAQSEPQPVLSEEWRDTFAERKLFQSRSYFAVRLPHGWWLWAVDTQLDASIDAAQLAYFEQARTQIEPDERVVLCVARPSWIDGPNRRDDYWISNKTIMIWFLDRMFGNDETCRPSHREQVPVLLTGDKHHYAHYVRRSGTLDDGPTHLVTCGGGGAFLAATHHLEDEIDVRWRDGTNHSPTTYNLQTGQVYPDRQTSQNLRNGWWRIPSLNGVGLPILLVALQFMMTLLFWRAAAAPTPTKIVVASLVSVLFVAVFLTLTALLSKFTPKSQSWPPGIIHGLARLAVAAAMAFVLIWALRQHSPLSFVMLAGTAAAVAVLAIWGFALYLRIANNFGLHDNELFSAMAISDYKSYLRLTFSAPETEGHAGPLRIEAIGIESVTRNGKDGKKTSPTHVIDDFTVTP